MSTNESSAFDAAISALHAAKLYRGAYASSETGHQPIEDVCAALESADKNIGTATVRTHVAEALRKLISR